MLIANIMTSHMASHAYSWNIIGWRHLTHAQFAYFVQAGHAILDEHDPRVPCKKTVSIHNKIILGLAMYLKLTENNCCCDHFFSIFGLELECVFHFLAVLADHTLENGDLCQCTLLPSNIPCCVSSVATSLIDFVGWRNPFHQDLLFHSLCFFKSSWLLLLTPCCISIR